MVWVCTWPGQVPMKRPERKKRTRRKREPQRDTNRKANPGVLALPREGQKGAGLPWLWRTLPRRSEFLGPPHAKGPLLPQQPRSVARHDHTAWPQIPQASSCPLVKSGSPVPFKWLSLKSLRKTRDCGGITPPPQPNS